MKKLIVCPIVFMVIFSCKKDKNDNPSCTTDMASISGSYKIAAYPGVGFDTNCDVESSRLFALRP